CRADGRLAVHRAAVATGEGESMMLEFGVPASEENLLLRLAVEHFLFEEAAHLDSWRLDEWLTLFTEDAHYLVPTTDHPDGDPSQDMMFIDDDYVRLAARVKRL